MPIRTRILCLVAAIVLVPIGCFSASTWLLLALTGGPGGADYDFSLSGGYSLARSSAHNHTITGPTRSVRYHGDSWVDHTDLWVDSDVIELGWNSSLIVAGRCTTDRLSIKPGQSIDVDEWYVIDSKLKLMHGPLARDAALQRAQIGGFDPKNIRTIDDYDRNGRVLQVP